MRRWLPERLLFGRDSVQSVPGHMRHLRWRYRLRDLCGGLGDAVAERHQLRGDVPNGHLPVRHPVPALQQQLRGLQRDRHDVHLLPSWSGAQHA